MGARPARSLRRRVGALAVAACALAGATSCSSDDPDKNLAAARAFDGFPLLYAGDTFEGLELTHVEFRRAGFALFVYGDCEPTGGSEPSCVPPLQLQVQPLCMHLDAVARAPIWKRRQIRGAPVGTIDSAPVVFTRDAQVKAYRGERSDPGLAWRGLVALRSVNEVRPVIAPNEPLPPPASGVLEGTTPCRG